MQTPAHASQVYAFLRRNYRVSRNTRALWQFQQIAASSSNQVRIPTTAELAETSDEIVLLSALNDDGVPIAPSSNILCNSSTRFSYFTTRYKFAFILDMTDSCASVSMDGGHIYLESLTNCLCILLCSLAQTFTLPGCELQFQPEIDISVYVYFPLHRTPSHQVLIHGYRLSWSTLASVCEEISKNLKGATELLHNILSIGQPFSGHSTSSTMDSDDNINSHLNAIYSNSESSCAIINMLSYGITALQLMPEESTSGLVIITDGILDVPNLPAFEAVMRQIRARIISCSFVQIGAMSNGQQSSYKKTSKARITSLGHVPNEELLRFISLSTFGSFIHFDLGHINGESALLTRLFSERLNAASYCKRLDNFQNELLSWGFHKAVGEHHSTASKRTTNGWSLTFDEENARRSRNLSGGLLVSYKLVNQTVLQTSLENVLSLRLREGYTVKRVQIHKDEIEVHLLLPWRYDIQIFYIARSAWPLSGSIRTDIRVYKEAPVYFLQELNQLSANPNTKMTNIRNNLVRRYNDVVQTVSVTDRHLTLINTFAQNPSYYNVPETIKRGKAIFHIGQNDLQQLLLNPKEVQSFADFWRPIVILDGSLWQRFMYTHNLTILLANEPLTMQLFLMSSHPSQSHTTQNTIVSCRSSKLDFEAFLAEYFSFILLDGQSYIKFLKYTEADKAPYSFMLLRIMGQAPLLYLKFAFQANATTVDRHKIIRDFRSELIRLRPRSRMKSGNVNEANRKQQTSTPVSSSGSQRSLPSSIASSIQRAVPPCCVVLNKNIERLVLRPDPFPYESLGILKTDDDDLQHKNRTEMDSKRQALSKFFYIQTFVRSFESIKHSSNIPKRIGDIILDTFIRRRLQEGFHFAVSHNTIHTLVLEVTMNTPREEPSKEIFRLDSASNLYPDEQARTCLIQYRIYPVEWGRPTDTSPIRDGRSASIRRSSSIYCDQPSCYYFLTQCWIEPQDGFVETDCPELEFLNHCNYKQIVDKIGEVDRECFNTLVSFYFVKYLQERSLSLPRPILRAPRALTADIVRVPFVQDTVNLIRRSHQTYFDCPAFIDDYDRIKHDYIHGDGALPSPSLNSTLLCVLRERLCAKTYQTKPQLFTEIPENNNAFTRNLLWRSNYDRMDRLPTGLKSLKSSPYLLYLLNYNDQQKSTKTLTECEQYLCEMLFPQWEFLVCAEGDEYVYMILLPKTERDLFLLNTDLSSLLQDLIAHYSIHNTDKGLPIYDDCRSLMENLLDEVENLNGLEKRMLPPRIEEAENQLYEQQTGKYSQRRRPRRDTFTSSDFLGPHASYPNHSHSGRGTNSSSPIPISHSFPNHSTQSSSQPTTTTGYRRIYSPLTIDSSHMSQFEPSARRYSASAAVSPPSEPYNLHVPPIFNLIPPSPQQAISQETIRKLTERQWHIPIFSYSCNKLRLASSLLRSSEQHLSTPCLDSYVDYTKDDTELTTGTMTTTLSGLKGRKRDNSRRHDDDIPFPHDKQADDMRNSMEYAFATAFYKNCLLDLTTHRLDVESALSPTYQEHYEEIDLTAFLKAMCRHLSVDRSNTCVEPGASCEPTVPHIHSYLNDKFLEIISKNFHRVSPDSDYFYFCTDEDRSRQSRTSQELEDRLATNNNEMTPTASGPYKFDETNGDDRESVTNDDDDRQDRESIGTVHVHDNNDDDELELNIRSNRRRSDVSSSSLSNRSRELSGRGELLPLFLCFSCGFVMREINSSIPVKNIPLCITQLMPNSSEVRFDIENQRVLPSTWPDIKWDLDFLRVSFSLICVTFGRDEVDSQGTSVGALATNTPTFSHPYLPIKRYPDLNSLDTVENTSTCTGTTMVGDLNKNPLDKLRLSETQRRAISSCRQEIEWLLRDEQLSTYFTRRSLDSKLIQNVIEHVQSSVNIHKSNCLSRSADLKFVLGIEKPIDSFIEELRNIRIRSKYLLTRCGTHLVLLEPLHPESAAVQQRQIAAPPDNTMEDQRLHSADDANESDGSSIDDEEEQKPVRGELDDYVKPSFWLFVEQTRNSSSMEDILEVKFYLYCGSSSDTTQKSSEPQAILEELINEFSLLCRTVNQKLLLQSLADSKFCNTLLVPPGENDDTSLDVDIPVLAATLRTQPGAFACDELWTHSFPLHFRLRPHLHASTGSKPSSGYHPGSLLREINTHFSSFAIHNRKNLFVYSLGGVDYYIRFREDIHAPSTPGLVDDSLLLSENYPAFSEPPSPQTYHQNSSALNSSMKNRQRHDSGNSCIHVMLYGLKSAVTNSDFESVKHNLIQMIVARLEEEVVKELVNALYHFAMTRLNPDDVTFIRPIDSSPKHVFEYKISPSINTNMFLYYFRRYVKTNQFHQPLLLPILAKDLKDIIKDYRGQILIVYNRTYNIRIPRPGLAWIELHVLNPSNRPSPLSTEDLSDELNVQSLIDLIQITECPTATPENPTENILRCNVWTRGSQPEIAATVVSATLLQAFTFALADYVTEYKLLPTLYHNQRHASFEPPPSPRSMSNVRFADETVFNLDRSMITARAFALDTIPTTPTVHSRRHSTNSASGVFHVPSKLNKPLGSHASGKLQRHESVQSSLLSNPSVDEPQTLSFEHADCLTKWFQYLTANHAKLPSLTSSSYTLTNRILLMEIIHNYTYWLNEQKFNAHKHEPLHGMIFRCNQERTLYQPVSPLDQLPTRVPGENLDLIVLYQSSKMTNDLVVETLETSPQQESGDAMAQANSSDIPKQVFLCIIANDKKLTMILHNAPDELGKLLMTNFFNIINWSNKRLNVLNIIVTQKMGLFRYRSFHHDQHLEYNRHHAHHSVGNKHPPKGENVDLELVIKDVLPVKTANLYTPWNIDLLYCNLNGSHPPLSNDPNQDLIQRHGEQLLQLRDQKKMHMDRCTKLEEICTNWNSKPKLFIADELLTQMKHRSRLLSIAVVPILFCRSARHFFQNDASLRVNNTLSLAFIDLMSNALSICFQDASSAISGAAIEGSLANRMINKRKSIAIPVDSALRRFLQSADENDYQISQTQLSRLDANRLNTSDQPHIQSVEYFVEQFSSHLQSQYKFHPISTKLIPRKFARSAHVQTLVEQNFHRSDGHHRATLLVEISSLNHVQLVIRCLQYDIVKIPINHQTPSTSNHFRQISNDTHVVPEQTELEAFAYDFHLENIIRHQTKADESNTFAPDFSLITFLQDFIEYYPSAPIGSKTAVFKTIIRHSFDGTKRSADTYLFRYILENASNYNIQSKKRNADEYLFDYDNNDIYWIAARTTPSAAAELTVVMYIIYTNLSPKQPNLPSVPPPSLNKVAIPVPTNTRIANSLKNHSSNNLIRERASTILLPSTKFNLVVPVRSNSIGSEQPMATNIPTERNVEYFRSKLISILNKAFVSHRRESLWERLIASRPDSASAPRQEITPINISELQSLLDSCVTDETEESKSITSLLQRVFANRDQSERLNRFLRTRYGPQFHMLSSAAVNYLVIFQCKAPQLCEAFLVLIYRSDQNNLKSYLIKHRSDINCDNFIEMFTQRISYFLWECLI